MNASPCPDYDRPPVVETILGVQFDRSVGFKNAHLGKFWNTLDNNEWPTVADAPQLPPHFERFTEVARWAKGFELQLTQDPSSRLQIRNKDQDRMIQVQNGRLHLNWLGAAGGPYPHYENMRAEFIAVLQRFIAFLAESHLGDLRPNQWEVTYLNHIPKGTVWNTPDEWTFFRPLAAAPTLDGLAQCESFNGGWHFVIPDQRGRLHVQWQHGRNSQAKENEMIILTLTARGEPEQISVDGILEGLDLGHTAIVGSFKNLMSNDANRFWGQKNASD